MDLYEYQGKELFARFGIPVSEGRLATSPEEARRGAGGDGGPVVVKGQGLTGGRARARSSASTSAATSSASSGSSAPPRSPRSTTSPSRSTAARRSPSSC